MTLRQRVHVHLDPEAWPLAGLSPLNILLSVAILLATAAAILETEPAIVSLSPTLFGGLEIGFGALFLLEYVARLWTAAERPGGTPAGNRLRFVRSPAGLIDLAVIAATVLPFSGTTLMPLRLVRLLRIVRLAKLGRTSTAFIHILRAVSARREELTLTAGFAIVLLIVGATMLHWLEADVQPEAFGSIPRALWWAVVTLTTIGYGDVYPVTVAGKLAASVIAFAGIGLIAMPTGILAAAFSESYRSDVNARTAKSDERP